MHNRLIFRYRCARAHTKSIVAKGLSPSGDEPTHDEAVSNEGTQEGK